MNYNNKIYKKLFGNEPELAFVEVEQEDDVFAIGKFLENCISGCFTDYDGFGKFVDTFDDKKYAIEDISFSIDEDEVYYKGEYLCPIFDFCRVFSIYEVVWFNK